MNRREAINELLFRKVPNIAEIIKSKRSKGSKIDLGELIEVLSRKSYNLGKDMTASASGVHRFVKDVFPDKGNEKLCTYLFNEFGFKYCSQCEQVLPEVKCSGDWCEPCRKSYYSDYMPRFYQENKARYHLYRIEREEALSLATPKWAKTKDIAEFYANCPEGYQVDHFYPLKGETVCGLHVLDNLRYLTAFENNSKGNKMPVE